MNRYLGLTWLVLVGWVAVLSAQTDRMVLRQPASNVIIPQSRPFGIVPGRRPAVRITGVDATIEILDTAARTAIEIGLENTSGIRQEAELVVPVPDRTVVKGFAYDGPAGPIEAEVLPRDQARKIYRDLVARIRDPGLVEFAGYNLIRSSVFPIEPHGKQRVRLTYEHVLQIDANRIDYILPRTESLQYDVPWKVTADIRSSHPISTVYCPTHTVHIKRISETRIYARLDGEAGKSPGPLRLSYLVESRPDDMAISAFAFPDTEVGGGYFLMLAGAPKRQQSGQEVIKREVILVVDRSGSMRDRKLEQAKEAALQVLAGLAEGEAFNIIAYSDTVELFSPRPVLKDARILDAARRYIKGITTSGGTNLYDALKTALEQPATDGMLPIILFLTDGLPTVGQTSEAAIRNLAIQSNPYRRRIFTFGVGLDVNVPLLDGLAGLSRARAEFVLPDEDVEVKVGKVFARLTGPILAEPKIKVLGTDGRPALGRVRDLLPEVLPDLFEADQLILLGQYIGQEPIVFELTGRQRDSMHTYTFTLDPSRADRLHSFVSRLWASRKIAQLIDLIRQMGPDGNSDRDDPKVKELTSQIVHLSTKFGILTEYTAFLAREGKELRDPVRVTAENLSSRAIRVRSGLGGIVQGINLQRQREQTALDYTNTFLNERMEQVRIDNVQQIHDIAFYNRDNRWVDSRLASNKDLRPDTVVEFGTEAFWQLVERLAREGRQASLSLPADVLLSIDGKAVLVKMPR